MGPGQYLSFSLLIFNGVSCSVMGNQITNIAQNNETADIPTRNEVQGEILSDRERERMLEMRRRSRIRRINDVRENILNYLGWSSFPNTPRQHTIPNVPPVLRNRCYYSTCRLPRYIKQELWSETENNMRLFFHIPRRDTLNIVTSATLKLLLRRPAGCPCDSNVPSGKFLVKLFEFSKPLRRRGRPIRTMLLDARMISTDTDRDVSFNVLSTVKQWVDHSKRNCGLEVRVEDQHQNAVDAKLVFITDQDCTDETERVSNDGQCRMDLAGGQLYEPTLAVNMMSIPVIDTTATVGHVDRSSENRTLQHSSSCVKVDVTSRIRNQLWVFPNNFEMSFCVGTCNLCTEAECEVAIPCRPTRTRPLSVLYYDQQAMIVKHKEIPDMIIEECGCS